MQKEPKNASVPFLFSLFRIDCRAEFFADAVFAVFPLNRDFSAFLSAKSLDKIVKKSISIVKKALDFNIDICYTVFVNTKYRIFTYHGGIMDIFGTAATPFSPAQPTIFAYLFFFGGILIGSLGIIWVKHHAKQTADIYNSAYSFNLMLVIFETVFYLVATVIASGVNSSDAIFNTEPRTIICGIFRAVCYIFGMLGYIMAVRHGPLLLTALICRIGLIVSILLSRILWPENSPIYWYMYLGIVLLLVALVLFNKKDDGVKTTASTSPKFWFWAIMGGIGNGLEGFSIKLLSVNQSSPEVPPLECCLFYASIIEVIAFIILLFINPPQRTGVDADGLAIESKARPSFSSILKVSLVGAPWIIGYAITNATSFYTGGKVIDYLPTVFYFMAKTGTSILISFVNARFIFKEKLRPMQYLGVIIAVIGLILLNDWSSALA